jgi:hypothetical protein
VRVVARHRRSCGTRADELTRRSEQKIPLQRRCAGIPIKDIDFHSTQKLCDDTVRTANHTVKNLCHCLVCAVLIQTRVKVHTNTSHIGRSSSVGVYIKHRASPTAQVEECNCRRICSRGVVKDMSFLADIVLNTQAKAKAEF